MPPHPGPASPPRASLARLALLGLLAILGPATGGIAADSPDWIWAAPSPTTPADDTVYFRRAFRTPAYNWNARLTVAADDEAEVFLNGKPVAACRHPDQPARAEVSMHLNQGDNVLAVRARNRAGPAGLLIHLNLGGVETRQVMTDTHWIVSRQEARGWNTLAFEAREWTPAVRVGSHGEPPWGDILGRAVATPAEALRVATGFRVELLHSAGPDEGSWACLAIDPRGRIYLSPEGDGRPLLRVSLDAQGRVARREPVPAPIRFAMGLLFAHDGLYANAKGPSGNGLYRLTDTNRNDRFDADEVRLLKEFKGGGEHGYHALALGPDDRIYVLNGNVTRLPEGISARSPVRTYGEDVLSLNPDETTRAGGALAPGGHLLRTDPEGREWELFAVGLRNAYDFDFNADGELFTFDSDNEWDWGTPWYRPTRVYHCVSGAEIGWRDGTRAWADPYPDMIGSVLDIGIGSPCGVKFGTRSRFPARYRRALFLQDWSYGRLLAVHLEPRGATYRGTFEEIVRGQPLNLTSMAFGPDGALYFVTGGRGTQSGLYRLTHAEAGEDSDASLARPPDPGAAIRAVRRRLESFHGRDVAEAVPTAWPHLGSPDPALRYAARLVLEAQNGARWHERVLTETNSAIALNAMLALARVASPDQQPALLRALARFPLADLEEADRLLKLRVVQLSFLRQGRPSSEWSALAVEKLSARYPARSWAENRELSRLLIYLEAPGVIPRTLDLIQKATSQEQQIHYVSQLRNLRNGWTPEDRQRYFAWWLQPRDHLARPGSLLHWFQDVDRDYVDGANVDRHLQSFRREAIAAVPEAERAALASLVEQPIAGAQLIAPQRREFVREWTMADLLPDLDRASAGRDFERGRRAFIDTQCYACHRFGNAGGAVGPEITAAASKYSRRDLLESILEPSRVISDQYQNVRVFRKDDEEITGRLVRESAEEMVLETDPLTRTEQTIPRREVAEIRASTVSPMPEGLVNSLSREEILDLLAFLESGGKPDAPAFRPR